MEAVFGVSRGEIAALRRTMAKLEAERGNCGISPKKRKELVLAHLETLDEPATPAEIAKAVGCYELEAKRSLNSLRKAGKAVWGQRPNPGRGPDFSVWSAV